MEKEETCKLGCGCFGCFLLLSFFRFIYFILYVWEFCPGVIYVHHMYMHGALKEAQRRHWVPWTGWLWAQCGCWELNPSLLQEWQTNWVIVPGPLPVETILSIREENPSFWETWYPRITWLGITCPRPESSVRPPCLKGGAKLPRWTSCSATLGRQYL